jgi:hypothetical protein
MIAEFASISPSSSGGGGGSPISNPGVAYVQTNGNNATAEIGNPAKPYLTAQAAFDAGARSFYIGSGVAENITVNGSGAKDYSLFFRGAGIHTSIVSLNVTSTDSSVDLRVRSDLSVQFSEITASAETSNCSLELVGLFATTIDALANSDPTMKILFCEIGTDNSNLSGANMTLSVSNGIAGLNPPS